MNGHDGRRKADHDWKIVARCRRCGAPITEMRLNGRYARQEEHTTWCATQEKMKERITR